MRRLGEEAVMFGLCLFALGVTAVGYLFPPSRRVLIARMEDHLEHIEG